MLTSPPAFLVELEDLTGDTLPDPVRRHLPAFKSIADWARGYLCHEHGELGRSGAVCPYTQLSMEKGLFYMTVIGSDPGEIRESVEIRCHFHVPLSRARMGRLYTTREDTARALRYALDHADPPHLAIETYTWPILTKNPNTLVQGIVREFRWVMEQMGVTAASPR